jgi:hypothetical protein
VVPPRGLEPRTNGLKVRCSTVELEGRDRLKSWKKTLQQFGPEPGGRGYRLALVRPVADSASNGGFFAPGPYESLNVGLNSSATATSGDINADSVFWNTMTASNYSDGGTDGVGTFRQDTGWSPYRPAVTLTASAGSCEFGTSGTTMTLVSDCTTDHTITVPNTWTLDGAGHSITAVDPVNGHFLGAVVANAGASANVKNVTVTTFHLSDVCDGGGDRLRGIMLDGASGSITNNTVVGIKQGASGCQEGNAIDVRNAPFDNGPGTITTVNISGNTIRDYQKTGIVANGHVLATITNNTVTGAGLINYIAQNGIQVGFGGSATIKGNTVSGNWYTPVSDVACGILLYQANGVKASSDTLFGNERDNCNFGKGRPLGPDLVSQRWSVSPRGPSERSAPSAVHPSPRAPRIPRR